MLVIHKRKEGICHLLHVPVWCTKYLLIKCIYIVGKSFEKIVLFSSILGVGLFLVVQESLMFQQILQRVKYLIM